MAPRNRTGRRRAKGQSLPLIALMIVVLVAMVGLSVDVGNTFQEERQAVSAANAASIAGMNAVIRRSGTDSTAQVYTSILNSLNANGIQIADDGVPTGELLRLDANYIDPQGKPLGSITREGGTIPNNVGYVQVQLGGTVDTYFARVVGRPDLPINASAYAGQCSLGDGVYPIAINQALLDGNNFARPTVTNPNGTVEGNWRVLQSGQYRGYTAREVYVHDGSQQPGNFGFLRWKQDKGQMGTNATSRNELEASLSGTGNLSWGFDEAPEPNIPGQTSDPNNPYPTRKNDLNEGDWVWGTPGWKVGGQGPINDHIRVGTKMVLPIYDQAFGNGSGDVNGVRFRIVGFGSFVILAADRTGNDKSFDMVYLGPAVRQMTACQFDTVPANDADCCELWGEVSLWPEYQIVPQSFKPVQYMVVLDQSGSMSANFNGQCDRGGNNPPAQPFPTEPSNFWQCANGPLYDTNGDGKGDTAAAISTRVTGTGSTYFWSGREDRRITVAKRALETLIGLTHMQGNTGYDPNLPSDQMALMWFTDTVQRDGNNERFAAQPVFPDRNFSSTPGELTNKMWARTTHGDIFRTTGGTNGAAALYRASLILGAAPSTITHNGVTYDYKKVVLFITDGVSNQFFHPNLSNLRVKQSSWNTYPNGSACRDTYAGSSQRQELIIEDAECQSNRGGGTHVANVNGSNVELDRPVTQAVRVSQDILQANGVQVFVVALSDLPSTGLAGGVSSRPETYYPVPRLERNADGTTNVDRVIATINERISNDRCQQGKDPAPTNRILPGQFDPVTLQGGTSLTYPRVGMVTVKNTTTNASYTTFIEADSSGRLTYRFAKVPPGIYAMNASVYFKHPNEPPGIRNRAYIDFFNGNNQVASISVEVTNKARAGSFLPSTQKDIEMRLRGDVCAGAGTTP
ncbi:MAG TPA: VWA domain-containing protein [Chloroflexaceae bacterium]|nr:VWA domain-containing protein [Chloroflexaceae bacterium]